MSGVLIAALGPLISPLVALYNSVSAGEFADIPANVVNAFFNGATLDVGQLLPDLLSAVDDYAIEGSDGGEHIDALFFAFGGLFSPGLVRDGVGDVENGVGGSILNSLGMNMHFVEPDDFAGGHMEMPAIGVGPIAAMAGLLDIVGQALSGDLLD
jgi:hypothetical protein